MTKKMKQTYTIPEYYKRFSCKGPDCRATCCNGWGISISMREYFLMLGLPCSPALRRRLDCAFHIADVRDEQRYACVSPKLDGDCPMHCENGYCAIHAECGEQALPLVCRYYPRSPRTEFARECSCANSCEGVLELLFEAEEPLAFCEEALEFELLEAPKCQDQNTLLAYKDIRALVIGIFQDRTHRLSERMMRIGRVMAQLDEAFESGDVHGTIEACSNMGYDGVLPGEGVDSEKALELMSKMAHLFGESSLNIQSYSQLAKAKLEANGEGMAESYRTAATGFEERYPEWDRLFEHMLVNHVFFTCFPFSDKREGLWEEYVSLCAVYGLIRFLSVAYLGDQEGGLEKLVDVCAAAFRLIDHSSFDWNALVLLHTMNATDQHALDGIVSI